MRRSPVRVRPPAPIAFKGLFGVKYVSLLLFILATFSIFFAVSLIGAMRTFKKNAKTTVATVVGSQGKRALVTFRHEKRVITTRAASFDETAASMGQKVPVKYLPNAKSPDKWDVRIIGKSGYGQNKIKWMAVGFLCLSLTLAALALILTQL